MPNWCENRLMVSGDTKELKRFLAMGIAEEPVRYSKTGEKELVWRMSNYLPTPEELSRSVSPPGDREWMNEWEVNHAKRCVEEQPTKIAELEKELETTTGEERMLVLSQLEEARKPIAIPELVECSNGTEEKRKALKEKYGYDNWYDWCHANWGTKWDCSSEELGYQTDNESYFETHFNSAWSPPIGWLSNVIKLFPTLNFKLVYMETGNWFAGCAYSDEGELYLAEGEPEYQYDGVTYKYNSDSESYVGEDGNVMTSDEWEEVAQSYPYNPFDDFDAPWE
jgi:hypothetical protein